jgi:hypothetical protein
MVLTVAKKICFYCGSKNAENNMRWFRIKNDVVWYGCYICAKKMSDELYGKQWKGKSNGKHAA